MPHALFRRVAVAEAITWALLLFGMVLKYVTHTTELGVRVFGLIHGVVFIAYCLTALVLWVDQRWSFARGVLALASAVPPFATVLFEKYAGVGRTWRLRTAPPTTLSERLVAWLLANPAKGLATALLAVLGLTAAALLAGPPVG